jgi:hypothetical protein
MFCQNCGIEITAGSAFCQNCGIKAEVSADSPTVTTTNTVIPPAPPQPQPIPANPVYSTQPVTPQPPVFPASPVVKPKKRHVGLWIFLTILVLATAGAVLAIGSAVWFGPKDLGIRYTQADFNKVIKDLGVHITADFGNGDRYDNIDIVNGSETATGYFSDNNKKSVKVDMLDYKEYNWEFSKFEKKIIKVNDVQATALLNEIAPPFFWLKNTQVKIEPDGSLKFSSSLNIRNIIRDLFQSVADKIPIKLPEKLNIYLEGKFSIKNNVVGEPPTTVTSSIYTVPEKYLTDENVAYFVSYFTALFDELNLPISVDNLYVQDGEFVFEGYIPTEVKVTPKDSN